MTPQSNRGILPPADVCLIAVTYNSADHIGTFLSSVDEAAAGLCVRVVVVDNASVDDTVVQARSYGAVVLETGDNLGYAAGLNRGREVTLGCSAVLVANPDLHFEPGSIRALHEASTSSGAVTVPALRGPDGSTRLSLRREPTLLRTLGEALLGDNWPNRPAWLAVMVRDPESYRRSHTVDWATGAAMMIPRRCDVAVGDWDESYFLYCEETDYARRARDAGFDIEFVPSAEATHDEGGSGRSEHLVALDAVNRVRYAAKWHARPTAVLFGLAILLELVLRVRRPAQRAAIRCVAGACMSVAVGSPLLVGAELLRRGPMKAGARSASMSGQGLS
jgi:GT2 family glycosyltransferase